jgi:hypothetical protein
VVWGGGGVLVALLVIAAFTCNSPDTVEACPTPRAGTTAEGLLSTARSQAGFPVLYPCQLPAAQRLEGATVTGSPGRRQAEFVFEGPFDLTIRQSQFPPPVNPDPTGASRIVVDVFPNVQGTLIERNDGSTQALYHLFWTRNGLFYEVQAVGPPLQRRWILMVATSLQ